MKLLTTILLVSYSFWSYSQCTVTIETVSDTVDCGGCFDLTAVGIAQDVLLHEDFDNSQLGPGWTSSQTLMYTNPCGAPPNGTPAAWFGNQQAHPRELTTIDYDMTCGGDICFMMKYATQSGSGSCEGPDLANEGVYLEYSINGGTTWVTIQNHTVLGNGSDPYQTSWNQYCYPIPPAAQTTSTRFRWIQKATSSALNDHWGVDDIMVIGNLCGTYYYDWFVDGTTNSADTNLCITQNTDTYHVIYTDGISDTCSASIDMYGYINPNLQNDTSICGIIDYDIVSNPTGGSGNYSFQWNTGDTDNTIENATTGVYYVDIQDGTYPGCSSSDTINFRMYPNPIINFSASPLCQGDLTNFQDLTVLPPGYNILSWNWNFNDQGATSTVQNPSHSFSGVGNYNVSFNVVSDGGCVADTTIPFFINPSPFADFDFNAACDGDEVNFTNQSLGNIVSSKWIFANETDTVYTTDASFTFPSDGSYNVTLIVEDANCTDTSNQSVLVNPLPDLSFTADPMFGEPVLDVSFYNDPSGLISNYWDFADGNSSMVLNDTVFNSFISPGIYSVVHSGTSIAGCYNSYSLEIIVEYPAVIYEIPNVVTPNNDGVNDGFYINYLQSLETITEFNIVFLNRWGNVIRTYDSPIFIWDGRNNSGNVVSDGTYFYKMEFSTIKGDTYNEHGFVQVVNK